MNAIFLVAGIVVGYRLSLTALAVALPTSIAAAWAAALIGWSAPGILPIAVLCILFEFGFFAGCCLHSFELDRAIGRGRFAGRLSPPSR